ncbi:MAG TPA: HAMP domain-containing sensor histidine kinase, partial [Thermoanaerobaculia bacterium]|nr:HAMP domain-containing sensor histidine kinase [Thermoanaerobaculia bacterium]
ELKTPTAVLVGEAQEALRPEATSEERRHSLEVLERVARGLAREVDSLLLLAKGDAAPAPRTILCDLSAIAEETVAAQKPFAATRSVQCRLVRDGPAAFRGDRNAIGRAASNLLSNAIAYTDRETCVEVEVGQSDSEVFLEVRDSGPGIPPEQRARIFERFVRLEEGRGRNPEGSGLGLAIVDQVVRAHGGRIEVGEREGRGAIFRLWLPGAVETPRG